MTWVHQLNRMWEIAVCPSWSRVTIALDQHVLIGSATLCLKTWHFPEDNCTAIVFYVLWSSGTGMAALKDHLSLLRSVSRWKVPNLGQVSIIYSRTWHSHILSTINQTGWWEMLKLSKRRRFREWSLWMIRTMDPWALWHGPVMCCGGKTCCKHIMQRISHPWPFSFTTLGFSVMYSLASLCAWCCIHCPSGVRPGCHFYHFIFTSIIKLVYWVRQHRRFILFSLLCTITSFSMLWAALIDSPPSQCDRASLVAGPWHHKRGKSALLKRFKSAKMRFGCVLPSYTQNILFMFNKGSGHFSIPIMCWWVDWLWYLLSAMSIVYVLVSVIITCSCGCWDTPWTSNYRCSTVFSVFTVIRG